MALTAAWMSACDMLGVKTQTLGPNIAVTASVQRLGDGEGSALAPPAVAVRATTPKTTAPTRRRTIRCIKTPHYAGSKAGRYGNECAQAKVVGVVVAFVALRRLRVERARRGTADRASV